MQIAFLGMGIMGRPMARQLISAGHQLSVWNRTPQRAQLEGARIASNPAEAAEGAEVVWLCLSDSAAVEQVLSGPQGVLQVARSGMIIADSSTIAPKVSRQLAQRAKEKGARFVDCPVTGSKRGAEAGELIFIVGGEDEPVEKLHPLFMTMGKRVFHLGGNGMGAAAKLSMNLNVALIYEGLAEGLVLAEKSGISAHQMLEIMGATMLRSGVMEYKGPFIERGDFSPNFPLRLLLKDIHLMLDHARENRVKLPALETVEEIYAVAAEEGMADEDFAAILKLLEKWAGVAEGSKAAD